MKNKTQKTSKNIWTSYRQAFIISLFLFFVGFYGGIKSSINDKHLLEHGVETMAIVTDSYYVTVTTKAGYWRNSVEYQVGEEKIIFTESSLLSRKKGSILQVVYDPQYPINARIKDSWPSGWIGYLIGVVGLIPSAFFLLAELFGFLASRL